MANLKERFTKTMVEKALRKAHGIQTHAAKILGCDRGTIHAKIEKYDLQYVIDEAREELVDRAEYVVSKHLSENNLTSAFFILNTLGKSRGYSQKVEMDVRDVTFRIVDETASAKIKNGNHGNGQRNGKPSRAE